MDLPDAAGPPVMVLDSWVAAGRFSVVDEDGVAATDTLMLGVETAQHGEFVLLFAPKAAPDLASSVQEYWSDYVRDHGRQYPVLYTALVAIKVTVVLVIYLLLCVQQGVADATLRVGQLVLMYWGLRRGLLMALRWARVYIRRRIRTYRL